MRLLPNFTALTSGFYHPYSLSQNLNKLLVKATKTVKLLLHNHFSVGDLCKYSIFTDFTVQVQLFKNTPKT